jgi:hypothetical protein
VLANGSTTAFLFREKYLKVTIRFAYSPDKVKNPCDAYDVNMDQTKEGEK